MRLMVCGSRDAAPALLDYARRCVERALLKDMLIVCGDATGVDGAVCEAAHQLNAACFTYGIQPTPRNGGARNPRSLYINLNDKRYAAEVGKEPGEVTYTDRDQYLVRHVSVVMCLWNGLSTESGTYKVYEYAKTLSEQEMQQSRREAFGKKVILVTLEGELCKVVSA